MSILTVDRLTKLFGSRSLLQQVSFHIEEKDRVGLVGANGTGKTTLFRLITGTIEPDDGRLVRAGGLNIGTMEQHVPEDTQQTAMDWMLSAFQKLLDAEAQMEAWQQQIEAGEASDDLLMRFQHLQEQYERDGGLWFRSKASAALSGLGFTQQQKELPLASLSGGQRSKLGLARLLVSPVGLLLLDEPTNHLDISAIQWLEEFLVGYEGAFIVISHDRYFLDKVTQKTMELEHCKLSVFNGNYTQYLAHKKERLAAAQHHYEQQQKEISRMEGAVTEMRRWNREKSIKRAESKEKAIQKLKDELEKPEQAEGNIRFSFSVSAPGPVEVLNARNLSFGFDEKVLYQNADFGLRKGERVFLIGPNGCGKTTLLKHLLGQINGTGTVTYGPGVSVGYYDQTGQQLHGEKTVLDEVWDDYRLMDQTAVRSALAAFLFKGDDVFREVSVCSGGEKARIALLKTMLRGCNLLLLDEPTNHLDIGSREALEDALSSYSGTLLMVSHDRYFINKLADRVLLLTAAGLRSFDGDYDDYLMAMEPAVVVEKKNGPGTGGLDYQAKKQRESQLRKLKTSVSRMEQEILQWEDKAAQLREQINDSATASDYMAMMELTEQLQEADAFVEEYTQLWAEQLEQLEKLETQ